MFDVTKEAFKHTRLFANQKAEANADKAAKKAKAITRERLEKATTILVINSDGTVEGKA